MQKTAIVSVPTYHKLFRTDEVRANAAAATMLTHRGSYIHHEHVAESFARYDILQKSADAGYTVSSIVQNKAIAPMPTYHMILRTDGVRADTATANTITHRGSYMYNENTSFSATYDTVGPGDTSLKNNLSSHRYAGHAEDSQIQESRDNTDRPRSSPLYDELGTLDIIVVSKFNGTAMHMLAYFDYFRR